MRSVRDVNRLTTIRESGRPDAAENVKRFCATNPWHERRWFHRIRYILAHWPGLIRLLDDGTLELDTNPVENQIRPIALTRKNALFAGNELGAENWAMLAALVATCKLSGVNPVDYLADTLRAILDGHPGPTSKTS